VKKKKKFPKKSNKVVYFTLNKYFLKQLTILDMAFSDEFFLL